MKTPSAYVEAMQTVDITGFVELDDVNPTFFHKPYYMEPQKGGDKANALLREALKKSSKIGIAKAYGGETDGQGAERKYSPGECCGTITGTVGGNPDKARVSTSYVERQILTMRMGMRRFTRLANGFSKKVENRAHAVALHFMYYNFGRIHKTLCVTPPMEAGVADHVWPLEEIAGLTS